jgi:hypothetical protein
MVLVLSLLALGACRPSSEQALFRVVDAHATPRSDSIELRFDLDLKLSREAQQALRNGVPLVVELEAMLEPAVGRSDPKATVEYRIHYLPLSDHYELLRGDQVSTWPRLRHLLAEIGRSRLALDTGVLPPGEYSVSARCRLDLQQLPPPMRLPALVSAGWRHDSGWTSWPVELGGG